MNQELALEPVQFELPIRCPNGGGKWAIGYRSLELEGTVKVYIDFLNNLLCVGGF